MEFLRVTFGFVKRVYGHIFVRAVQRYNVEERADKLLDKMDKAGKSLVKAPLHKPTRAYLEQLIKGEQCPSSCLLSHSSFNQNIRI